MTVPTFSELTAETPTYKAVAEEMQGIRASFTAARDQAERMEVLGTWDAMRRRLATWYALTGLRFQQDTRDEEAKKARQARDALWPKLEDLDVGFKRSVLDSGHRTELEEVLGTQAFARWETDIRSFDSAIEEDLVRESELKAEYVELIASARLEFQGEGHNLSGMLKFAEELDRDVRHDAWRLYWGFFQEKGAELDRIFADLTRLRSGMADTLGLQSFTDLGYLRMSRVDYDQDDVEAFRAQVREHLVPLAVELKRQQADRLGVDPLRYWDESLYDLLGNPKPQGDHDWMLERAQEMFDGLGGGLGEFFRFMNEHGFLDLKTREGKAGGGFCTTFASHGAPFVFANFNGTQGDVKVFTHEIGHAFQKWCSRGVPIVDYLFATAESAEVHSMSLEFLSWPYMEKFFGDDAERFRRIHLTQNLLFLPYGVAVDHFQHLVYAKPEASPAERHAMWQEMERTYLPWRDYGDLERPAAGAFWQRQRHITLYPFYYIDYTLALTCALQFWAKSLEDRDATMKDYVALCGRGGSLPFRALARSAGLVPPFEEGCLTGVVERAKDYLGL